jgi:hypothetical protein
MPWRNSNMQSMARLCSKKRARCACTQRLRKPKRFATTHWDMTFTHDVHWTDCGVAQHLVVRFLPLATEGAVRKAPEV